MGILLLLLVASVVIVVPPASANLENKWIQFQLAHKKHYVSRTEIEFRKKIFLDNMRKIEEHNANYNQNLVSYHIDANQYTDLLHQEFVDLALNGIKRPQNTTNDTTSDTNITKSTFKPPGDYALPASVDWRSVGAVTEVKSQGHCSSCWSFSATGAIESQVFFKTKKLISLSEQNLVDCTLSYGNYGCDGGWPENAYKFVTQYGIDSEDSYPYETKTDTCRYSAANNVVTLKGYADITSGDENELKMAVATVGPISTILDATGFQFYKGGVYDYPNCKTAKGTGNHAVLIVGYGTTSDGVDYWIIKNSWGDWWGDKGYGLMARNKNNSCGIATECSYPLI